MQPPYIVFWQFDHFLVVEGIQGDKVYLNDPAVGPRTISAQEFDSGYTGVVLVMQPGTQFKKGGKKKNILETLTSRLQTSQQALLFCLLAGLLLTIPRLAIPAFTQVFTDDLLIENRYEWLRPLILGMLITTVL
ncbi:MAG: cysteine peptidase family C39 domain-containing protein, partial [Microcystis sp.]